MEHSSHSPLLSHGHRDVADGSQSAARPATPSTAATGSPYHNTTPQNRRLQLRHTRFNGPSLPTRRLSPVLGLTPGPIESFSRPGNTNNSPLTTEKRSLYGEFIPPSPINILQEIHNSTKKKRTFPRPGFGMIFEDPTSMDENSKRLDDDEISWYDERSTECSPSMPRAKSSTMGLRESSVNQQSQTPLVSPLAKQSRSRSIPYSSLQSDNVEQSRYIEHLESQLVSAQAKIDTLTSPKTNKMRSVKLRSLAVENRNLRTEISEWAVKAEEMVQEERLRYADLEVDMNMRLQALEEDVEIKDARIAEFEWELESMRTQLKNAEGLEEANASLEKKIDMLSSMLVNSPDKLESRSGATSPTKGSARFSPSKRTPRPTSMLSRVSSSPIGTRTSLASVSETALWDSRSRSASIVEASEDSSPLETQKEQAQSPTSDGDMMSPDSSKRFSYSGSYDENSNWTSCDSRTGPSSSRPTSFMSMSSTGAPSWGVPMLPDGDSRFSNRQRRMRKFPSGSNTLKPLILPVATTTSVQSSPTSASIYPSIETVASRDISYGSTMDPLVSSPTGLVDDSQNSTPIGFLQRRSSMSAREQTLTALEGRQNEVRGGGEEAGSSSSLTSQCSFSDPFHVQSPRPNSLQQELEQAEVEQAHLNALGISAPDGLRDNLEAETQDTSNRQNLRDLTQYDTMVRACSEASQGNKVNTPPTPKANNSMLHNSTSDPPRSLFARLTNLITRTKQDPFVLARRILVNAWALGNTTMGGLGWWLIGPMHHHQRYHSLEGSSNGAAKERSRGSSNWQHFSTHVRNGRVVDTGSARDQHARSHLHSNDDENPSPMSLPRSGRGEPHLFPCDDCIEPSSRRTLRMWFQFSLTVVLTVGLAVKYGPGVLLAELSDAGGRVEICPRKASERIDQLLGRQHRHERMVSQNSDNDAVKLSTAITDKSRVTSSLIDSRDGADSGYGSIAFAEMLGPADFEAG